LEFGSRGTTLSLKGKRDLGMSYTKISAPIFSRCVENHHKRMLKSSLRWMNQELDRYIKLTQEVPWFYNERAVLGFFISGLIREGNATVLQEFSCQRGSNPTKKNSSGRADLYFSYNEEDYLVESKWCMTSVNERSACGEALKWAKRGLRQANRYRMDAKVERENIFALCFEAISTTQKLDDYRDLVQKWQVKEETDLAGLDFYSLIQVTSSTKTAWHHYQKRFFPALAIYGLFNH
jgi:hypothetical protein